MVADKKPWRHTWVVNVENRVSCITKVRTLPFMMIQLVSPETFEGR